MTTALNNIITLHQVYISYKLSHLIQSYRFCQFKDYVYGFCQFKYYVYGLMTPVCLPGLV